jgi:alpha-galactosidase
MSIGSLRNNIRHTLNMSALHKRWWWNDPDCVMVRDYDTTLNEDEVKSNLSLVGLSGGLMISSDDLTRLAPERQKLVALLTPLLGQAGQPLDLLEREMAELYVLPVDKGWSKWHDVAVFNWSDKAKDRWLDTCRLGYEKGEQLHIFDFWSASLSSSSAGELLLGQLPAHGCRLLRVCRADEAPQLVGDTLHITQGLEIESWAVSGKTLKLRTADLERDVSGDLWIKLPGKLVSAACNLQPVATSPEAGGIYKLSLSFQGRAEINIAWE